MTWCQCTEGLLVAAAGHGSNVHQPRRRRYLNSSRVLLFVARMPAAEMHRRVGDEDAGRQLGGRRCHCMGGGSGTFFRRAGRRGHGLPICPPVPAVLFFIVGTPDLWVGFVQLRTTMPGQPQEARG